MLNRSEYVSKHIDKCFVIFMVVFKDYSRNQLDDDCDGQSENVSATTTTTIVLTSTSDA
jgi:hypothetical protein